MAGRERFVAIIGDLVASRGLADRAGVQRQLKSVLQRMERDPRVEAVRAAGPQIIAGDELQLLLRIRAERRPGDAVLAFLGELAEDLPAKAAFGVGLGGLTTGLVGSIGELDGPCFHRARRALEAAKRKARWVIVAGLPSPYAAATNSILRLTGEIRSTWTDRQKEVVRLLRGLELQKEVARSLRISPSVVSEILSAARYDAVREAERAAAALLDHTSVLTRAVEEEIEE